MGAFKRCMVNSPLLITILLYGLFYYFYLLSWGYFDTINSIIFGVIVHVLLIMSIVSFFTCFVINPGYTPHNFNLDSIPEDDKITLTDEFLEIDYSLARITFCKKCDSYRPARSHHCSTCEKCVLRYDHHCPFVGNCIGIRNQKAFILFLLYTGCTLILISILCTLEMTEKQTTGWYIITGICWLLCFYILGFGITQFWMLATNFTTLEMDWKQNIFDKGSTCENLKQIIEDNPVLWFIPLNFKIMVYPFLLD